MDLRILQINIKSLNNNKINLQNFLCNKNIDVLILCETWLLKNEFVNFFDFNAIHFPREDGYGGVSIYTRKQYTTNFKFLSDISPIEALEVELTNIRRKIKIISIYIPQQRYINNTTLKLKFGNLLQKYINHNNIIIAGDINAHNALWNDGNNNNSRGNLIADIITNSNFTILNDGSHTFEMFYNDRLYRSALDITLCSSDLAVIANWERIDEFIGSDHLPIITTLKEICHDSNVVRYRVDHDEAVKYINEIKVEHIFYFDDFLTEMDNKIKKATHTDTFNTKKRTPKVWWNENIKKLWIIKAGKQKMHNKFKSLYVYFSRT